MDSSTSGDHAYLPGTVQDAVKILVVGDFGVGKTTLIGSVSEIPPLRTEETMTQASVGVDDLSGLDTKDTTTVALDFGRLTLSPRLALYLFGTGGQHRFWAAWRGLSVGSVGVLVIVDTRRLDGAFAVLDVLETQIRVPFAIAVNTFPDSANYTLAELRQALDLTADTPIVICNALDRRSCVDALITLVGHATQATRAHSTPSKVPS
jgi:signal recognition particle receptor subunit beta